MTNELPLDELGDAELLRRSRRSSAAFRVVYDRHAARLYAFLLTAEPRDRTAAFELTAETFAAAWLSRDRFVDRGDGAAPWLFGIARHVLATSIREASIERSARRRVGLDAAADVADPRPSGWTASTRISRPPSPTCRSHSGPSSRCASSMASPTEVARTLRSARRRPGPASIAA